jgi:hypothetical protein
MAAYTVRGGATISVVEILPSGHVIGPGESFSSIAKWVRHVEKKARRYQWAVAALDRAAEAYQRERAAA